MKKIAILTMAVMFGVCLSFNVFAADKDAIQKNVEDIAAAIDGGKAPAEFKANDYDPYAFIMEASGNLIVHPTLAGKNLQEESAPLYDVIIQSTPEGIWVDYEWQGKMKHSYLKTTQSGLIVGSGYSD
ncbi:MAG: hypothetical protein R6X05_13495 [Desulfobacterales bacterium]|jgi:hypothetical protein